MKQLLILFILCQVFEVILAQTPVQTVRGTITDKASGMPLPGAIITVVDVQPVIGTASDMEGNFRLSAVPVGERTIRIVMIGYREVVLFHVPVNSGKELVLQPALEEEVQQVAAVEIVAEQEKNQSMNSMSSVSARTFSVEETQKFAAAVNDPGRMVTSFAGVVSADDGSNNVSIRGNAPTGLLWRMEGNVIPNPNHFAQAAGSGGGISILSAQLLDNSDFFTGAFPAEYGNALGGVFDLRLRKGNNEKREYTIQAGFLGLNLAAEGPLSRRKQGSYLVNYRYSTLSLLQAGGLRIGSAVTNFQDVSWHLYVPTEKTGTFSVFGFVGISDQSQTEPRDSSKWEGTFRPYDFTYYSHTGSFGVKHVMNLSEKAYLQTIVSAAGHFQGFQADELLEGYRTREAFTEDFVTMRFMFSSVLNKKINARNNIRTGVYYTQFDFDLLQRNINYTFNRMENKLNASGTTGLLQGFGQWKYRHNEALTLNAGLHSMHFLGNGSTTLEPRLGLRYMVSPKSTWTAGYGLHSQMQSMGVLMAQVEQPGGRVIRPNEDLGFNMAHHLVAGHERRLGSRLHAKIEVYVQHLYNIAIGSSPGSTFSTLNVTDAYVPDPMTNGGLGRNVGLEFTLEQFTHNGLYFLWSNSLYDSKYQAQDGIWRNTRFNGSYSSVFTAGKEWTVGDAAKHRTLGLHTRVVWVGGMRYTPIDLEASKAAGETRTQDALAYSLRNRDYFRLDLRVSLKRNRPGSTSTWSLDVQNATNRKNEWGRFYDAAAEEEKVWYQVPLIPVLNYRIDF